MKAVSGFAALLAAGLIGGCVGAGVSHMPLVRSAQAGEQAQAVTVFVDATFGFRKDHMARQLTDSHADYAAMGYHFADMQAYDENGDLQGFFVTYVRN